MNEIQRAQRAQGLCEVRIQRGPRRDQPCRWRARHAVATFCDPTGLRVCGTHARAFIRSSLVEIGTPGWREA